MPSNPRRTARRFASLTHKIELVPQPLSLISAICQSAEVPPALADHTMEILGIHARNGTLAWVADMVRELEEMEDLDHGQ